MTVRRLVAFPFGATQVLGEMERVDFDLSFRGYAAKEDFDGPGARLAPHAIERLRRCEVFCGEPDRFLDTDSSLINADLPSGPNSAHGSAPLLQVNERQLRQLA